MDITAFTSAYPLMLSQVLLVVVQALPLAFLNNSDVHGLLSGTFLHNAKLM
jgi:hypothetical protein